MGGSIGTIVAEMQEEDGIKSASIFPDETPQDQGKPSPVPYSVFIAQPSIDIDRKGKTTRDISAACKDLNEVTGIITTFYNDQDLARVIKSIFKAGYYRFELVFGDVSIRVYKHPNNH